MELSDVRRRLRVGIEEHRRRAAKRRASIEEAEKAYEQFLTGAAAPAFRMMAMALNAEGHSFQVFSPSGGLRLANERHPEDFIELELDSSGAAPLVIGRISRRRGSRVLQQEHALRENVPVERLSADDVVEFLLREIPGLLER